MSRSEIILLREASIDSKILEEAHSILSQMGIFYREELLPSSPSISQVRQLIEQIAQSVCIVAAGKSSYLLPIIAASVTQQQPLIVMPCPSDQVPESYLDTLFDTVRGYPVAFTRAYDVQSAVLLAVHMLVSRHPSYADILNAFIQRRHLQPA
ncbi:MAG: AIR carboxylase family protein [Bacteroidia bacterium]|nr:AIR carboxylase family protein [Bacteroidia bacterium]